MKPPRETSAGFLDERTAQDWIDEVRPLALSLIGKATDGVDPRAVRVRARRAESSEVAPYGVLMLTWPERSGFEAVINHLVDCRPFLALYELLLRDLGDAGRRFRAVLHDGTRLRIAVTNDVPQVLAAGPLGTYSMIRHHALMFFLAHLWLPLEDQLLWEDLYHSSIGHASSRYRESDAFGHVAKYLDELEHSAFAALERLAADPSTATRAAGRQEGAEIRLILSYMHAANAAVALLIDAYKTVPPGDRREWLINELEVGYRKDGYLLEAWAAMASA